MDICQKRAIMISLFTVMLLSICYAVCPPDHDCQNNGICKDDPTHPGSYICDCNHTDYTGKKCEYEKGEMNFLYPNKMVVGTSYVFTIILLKPGDHPRFYLYSPSQLSFEFLETSFRPVSEYNSYNTKTYPETAKIYQFWYTFSDKKEAHLTVLLINGIVDDNNDNYKSFLSQEIQVAISVSYPEFGAHCLPSARLSSVSSNILFATEFHRTDRIVITLGLKYYCDKLSDKGINYTWRLYRLDSTFPTPVPQNNWGLENIVNVKEKHIIFEPHQLMIGRYLIEVTFRVEGDKFNNTRQGFFNVEASKPKIRIYGGKEITASVDDLIELDASYTIDQSFPERSDELVFDWTCQELGPSWKGTKEEIIFKDTQNYGGSGAKLVLPRDTLTLGNSYTFEVNVSSLHSNTFEIGSQTVHTAPVGIVMNCVKCRTLRPNDVMDLQCSCPKCDTQPNFIFSWRPQKNVKIHQPDGNTALVTVPEIQGFRTGYSYVTCATNWNNVALSATAELATVLPPEGGSCSIIPKTGVYLIDTFTVTCKDFDTNDTFLQYEYYVKVTEGAEILDNKILLYYEQATGYDSQTLSIQAADIILPFGDETDDLIKIIVEVSKEGIVTSLNLTATVTIPGPKEYLDRLKELVFNPDSKLKSLLKLGYEQEALEIQSIIIYGLINRNRDVRMKPLIDLLKKSKLFSVLLKELSSSLTKMTLTNEYAMKQILGCINLLSTMELENEDDIDENDNSYLTETSSTVLHVSKEFRKRIQDGADLSLDQVESFGKTVADTASKILQLTSERGNSILQLQTPFTVPNERLLGDQFDLDDDISREYFLDDLSENEEDWGDEEFSIDTESNEKIAELAAATRNAFLALDYMMAMIADQRSANQDPFIYSDNNLAIHVEVRKEDSLETAEFILKRKNTKEFTIVKIPGTIKKTGDETSSRNVEIRIRELVENPFLDDFSAVPISPILSVVLKDVDSDLPISFDEQTVKTPIELQMPIHTKTLTEQLHASMEYNVIVRNLHELMKLTNFSSEALPIRRFILPYETRLELTIFDTNPNPNISFAVVFLKDELPKPSHFCESNIVQYLPNNAGGYTLVFETEKLDHALGETEETLLEYYVGIWVAPNSTSVMGANKTFRLYFARTTCLFRDESRKFWSEEGCTTKKNSYDEYVTCSCNHLSVFSATQFVFPHELKSIILTDFDLRDLEENFIILITVGASLIFYVMFLVLCWYFDRRTITNTVPITIMADLSDDFEYAYYLMIVVTGTRFDAGTSANVSLQIYGSCGRSQTYTLKEGGLAVCKRGAVNYYLVSSPKDLGVLEKIRLWHDNYGDSPSWYCNKIIIRNIKSDVESQFFVEQWVSVSHLNPTLIIEKQVGIENDERSFYRIFRDNMANEFNNSHLWLSVMTRPQTSSFTRCQRLTCAYAVFSSYMLLSIMFHGKELIDPRNQFEVGGHDINIPTLILWFQNILFALPIGFIVLFFFKNLREYEIPTLIIWKNMRKPDKSIKAEHLFVPKAPPPPPPPKVPKVVIVPEKEGNFYFEGEGSDNSSEFSLPSTDIKEIEGWVIDQTEGEGKHPYEEREPDAFIHAVKEDSDQNHMDRLHRLGRHALVHSVRDADPNAFMFTGDLDIKGIEKLIDERLKLQAEGKRESGDKRKIKEKQEPWQDLDTEDLYDIEEDIKTNTLQHGVPLVTAEEKKESATGLVIELCDMSPVHKHCGYLPWWFVFFAWIVSLGCIVTCNYFTIIFGLNLGYLKSLDWLIAVMSSFLISVILVQPVKIIIMSGLKTLFWRKLSTLHQDMFQLLIFDEERELPNKRPRKILVFRPDRAHPPLSAHEIFFLKMNARRLRELRRKFMYLVLYCFLLVPLILIAHSTHSIHNYRVTENLRNLFKLNEENKEFAEIPSEAFLNIKDEASLFGYLRLTFLPALHPTRQYNGDLINAGRFDPGFLADFTTILVGVARVRQLRMTNESCDSSIVLTNFNATCIADYSISRQDTKSYNPLWTPVKNGHRVSSATNDIWRFRSQEETMSLPLKGWMGYYDGGGYVVELGRSRRQSASVLKHLKRVNWFDEYTRCIFIEFTTFTPSLNIFTSVILMLEKGSSQGMKMTSHIYPMILLHPEFTTDDDDLSGGSLIVATSLFVTTFMVLVLCVIFIWRITNDRNEDIVTRFWFWLDLFIILSIMSSLYIAERTSGVTHNVTRVVDNMLINEFVNLQKAALWDQIQRVVFSVTQIFCFMRIWNILVHSNEQFLMLMLTLKLTSRILIGFIILFAILLAAFALAGNLIFGNYLEEFSTIPETFVTLSEQAILVDFFYELEDANRILGPLYFFCFGIFIVFVSVNLFVALLNQGLYQAKEIARERRHWITYWAYIKRFFRKMIASMTHRRVTKRKQSADVKQYLDILPSKLLEMKKVTIKCLQNKLHSDEEILMRHMKDYVDDLLQGTGFRMIPKGDKRDTLKANKENKMDDMRICTAEFIRIKTGVYMTPEELRKYEKYNTSISALRFNKLEKNVNLIAEKIDNIIESLQPETRDANFPFHRNSHPN